MTFDPGAGLEEEPWEAEIGALLGGLPTVEPPDGFIDTALRHRPLHAGRILTGLAALTIAALAGAVWTGAGERAEVAPPIDELADRHAVIRAGVFPGGPFEQPNRGVEPPVELPEGFRNTGSLEADGIRQAVYARGDESVSVFVQDGSLSWEAMPGDGLTEIDGQRAWVDRSRLVTVVEAGDRTVTIVGLGSDEVAEVLAGVRDGERSPGERARDLAEAIVIQLGFAPVDD